METIFLTIYNFYRNCHLEWIINIGVFSFVLYTLVAPKECRIKRWHFVVLNALTLSILMPSIYYIPYISVFPTQGSAIWCFFVFIMLILLFWSMIFFRKSITAIVAYLMFYLVTVILFKTLCSPLYGSESVMNPTLYAILDILTAIALYVSLVLLIRLFQTNPLRMEVTFPQHIFAIALYFPASFFLYCIFHVSGTPLFSDYPLPVLAAIILTNLPLYYYIFAQIIRTYEEKLQLNAALTQTQAQLARYRYSIELEERLRQERHELKNNYFYIQMLLNEHKYTELNQYLEHGIGEKMESLSSVQTGNTMIDYLLNRKLAEARKYKIKTYAEILVPEQLPVNDDVFCTILLNLLDNAMEASKQEQAADIHISIKLVQQYLVCKISNKVSNNVFLENPKLLTTKKDRKNHGLGLKIIRNAVKEQNGMFQTKMEDGYFVATVMLPFQTVD